MNLSKTQGLIAAPPTAFTEAGGIDLEVVGPLARHLTAQGVSGVFVNGTTGEGMSLTTRERERLAEAWREALPPSCRLFVHAGHNALEDAIRLARHAQETGADAIGCLAPFFFKPLGPDRLLDWCADIAAAAPSLPFYYYHMPSQTGVHLHVASFMRRAGARIPNFAGVKFTFEALDDYLECLRLEEGRFDVLWGRDEMLLPALAAGARGGVGSTYNIATPLYLRLIHAFDEGDLALARDLQSRSIELIRTINGYGNFFSVVKSVLRAQGVPIRPVVRQPLPSLDAASAGEAGRRCLALLQDEANSSDTPDLS